MLETLLDADYTVRDGKPVIRLFYRTEKGTEIREVADFEPYFYALPKEQGSLEKFKGELEKLKEVVKVEEVEKIERGKKRKVLKIVVRLPKDVPEIRNAVKESSYCQEIREAAIPFAERYLIDSKLVPMENCEKLNLRVAAFDLEVYNPKGEPRPEKDPILMISYADSEGLEKVWTTKESSLKFVENFKSEQEVIKKLIETIWEREIDLLVTYNGDNFDFPYLKERAGKFTIKLELGRDSSEIKSERRGMNLGAKVKGRPHVDLFPICRQIFNLSRYTLEDIYREISGEEKEDIKAGEMHKIWDSDKEENLKPLFQYSMSDARATLKIAQVILPLQYEISRITRDFIYQSSRSGSGRRVETLLMRRAFEENILMPNKPSDRIAGERRYESYVGAYVVEPKRGIHDSIILFDFRSLYPSIIISHNIDPATIDCDCCESKKEGKHHFCKNKKGFIPKILQEVVETRVEIKKKLKEEKNPEKRRFLEAAQQALKLLANSTYGYYAFTRARWYCRDCAETIAALGREYIQGTIKKVNAKGFEVIYGDTDSVYIIKPGETEKEKIVPEAQEFLKKVNQELPEAMELEYEGFYPRGIFITKKRYALLDEKGGLIVKGLETRRRDWANIAKKTQDRVLNALLQDKDPDKAAEIVKEMVQEIKSGKIPLKELAINTQLTRRIGEYVSKGPHVLAAMKAMKKGLEFKEGNIITYIVTRRGSSISDKSKVIDFVEEGDYDAEYYINNQVLPAVTRILEALGYSESELKGLGKQMKLGGF